MSWIGSTRDNVRVGIFTWGSLFTPLFFGRAGSSCASLPAARATARRRIASPDLARPRRRLRRIAGPRCGAAVSGFARNDPDDDGGPDGGALGALDGAAERREDAPRDEPSAHARRQVACCRSRGLVRKCATPTQPLKVFARPLVVLLLGEEARRRSSWRATRECTATAPRPDEQPKCSRISAEKSWWKADPPLLGDRLQLLERHAYRTVRLPVHEQDVLKAVPADDNAMTTYEKRGCAPCVDWEKTEMGEKSLIKDTNGTRSTVG